MDISSSESGHVFIRDKGKYTCTVCNGLWPSTDEIVPKYHSCSLCGLTVHTNCRVLAKTCLECTRSLDVSELSEFVSDERLNAVKGTFYITLLQAYDLHLAPGTSIYGKIQLYATGQATTTAVTTTGNNECSWELSSEGMTLDNSVNKDAYNVNAPIVCVENNLPNLTKEDFAFSIEIWTSFMGIFDSLVAKAEISLLPTLCFPNKKLERWFGLHNTNQSMPSSSGHHDMEEMLTANGKVLLRLVYRPEVNYKLSRKVSDSSVTSPITAPVTPVTVPSISSPLVNKTKPITEETPKKDTIANNIPPTALKVEMEIDTSDLTTIIPHTLSYDEQFSTPKGTPSGKSNPFGGEEHFEVLTNVPFTNNKQSEEVPMSPTGLSVATPIEAEPISSPSEVIDAAAVAQQGGALLQSILDFSEQTTNVIGNFLFEMEGLQPNTTPNNNIDTSNNANGHAKEVNATAVKASPVTISKIENIPSGTLHHVGLMQVHLISAVKTKVKDPADGDHFVSLVLEDSTLEWKTNSVYSSASPIFNSKFTIPMPHFRSAIVLYLSDAHSKRRIGFCRFSVYQILHRDAERTCNYDGKAINKQGSNVESVTIRDMADKEDLGYFTIDINFEENIQQMFLSATPKYAQECPPEEMSVEKLGVHVARFSAVIALFSSVYGEFLYITDWKDPLLTGTLFALFLYYTLRVSAEYALSGVALGCLILMTRMLYRRKTGIFKDHYVKKGLTEKASGDDYRPVAVLKTSVLGYKNLPNSSRPSVKVSYLPMIEIDDVLSTANNSGEITEDGRREFTIGYFNAGNNCLGCNNASNVVSLSNIVGLESPAVSKDLILQNINYPWPVTDEINRLHGGPDFQKSDSSDIALVYPIQQPIAAKVKTVIRSPTPVTSGDSTDKDLVPIHLPWDKCEGVLRFSLRYENNKSTRFNMIADSIPDDWIEVPIKDLVQSTETIAWYRVNNMEDLDDHHSAPEVDTMLFNPIGSAKYKKSAMSKSDRNIRYDDLNSNPSSHQSNHSANSVDDHTIQVLLRFELDLPSKNSTLFPSADEKTVSQCLSKILSSKPPKETGGAISVLWHARDHVKYVQNLMSWILDNVESFKNIWNWVSPSKTFPIYVTLIAIWILTILIPGRFLILLIGLYEFLFIILPIPDGNEIGIRFYNLLQSIPNDNDIEILYSKERKQYQDAEYIRKKGVTRQCHVNLPIKTLWKGNVFIKIASSSVGHSSGGTSGDWIEVYFLLQGRRLVWWRNEDSLVMDNGGAKEAPIGQLLLCGHCGVSDASPVDVKQFGDGSRLMSVFGKDALGSQQKLSIRCKEVADRQALYQLISDITNNE